MKQTRWWWAVAALVAAGLVWNASQDGSSFDELESDAGSAKGGGTEALAPTSTAPEGDARSSALDEHADADSPAAAAPPTHRLTGRVIDEARTPVSGARVAVIDGRPNAVEARTDAEGRYVLEFTLHEATIDRLRLFADDDAGRCARRALYIGEAREGEVVEREQEDLVLRAAYELVVRVLDGGAPLADAPVALTIQRSRIPVHAGTTDADGELRLTELPFGPVFLRVELAGRVARGTAWVPRDTRHTLTMTDALHADVLVVDAVTREPVAGARLAPRQRFAGPYPHPDIPTRFLVRGESMTLVDRPDLERLTDEDGRATFGPLHPDDAIRVHISAEDYASSPVSPSSGQHLPVDGELLTIELTPAPPKTVRWPLAATEIAPPSPGTAVEWLPGPPDRGRSVEAALPTGARIESGFLVADDVTPGGPRVYALTADGAIARVDPPDEGDLGHKVRFRPARRVQVTVVDEGGTPVEGAVVGLRGGGYQEMVEPTPTDANGEVRFERLHPALLSITLIPPGESSRYARGNEVQSVNLEDGDAEVTITHGPPTLERFEFHLHIDGRPALPAVLGLSGRGSPKVVEERPADGVLVVDCSTREDGTLEPVFLRPPGFLLATVDLNEVVAAGDRRVRVDLVRAAQLHVRIVGADDASVTVKPERYDEEEQEWRTPSALQIRRGLRYPNGPDGEFVFGGLEAGRWRAVDETSGALSEETGVVPGDVASVDLAIGDEQWVSGRVVVPDPTQLRRVRVRAERLDNAVALTPNAWWDIPGVALRDDAFRLRVPVDAETRLSAWHPWLTPAEPGGTVTVRGGRDGVVLTLVEGDSLRIPWQRDERVRNYAWSPPRIGRYAAGSGFDGDPLEWHVAARDGEDLRCALPAGEWDLLVDVLSGYAPLELRSVTVRGDTRVPDAVFTRGSTLRVEILTAADADPPRISIHARHAHIPLLGRLTNSRGEADCLLHGIGAGPYHIDVRSHGQAIAWEERLIEFDGRSEVVLQLDLR